MHSHPNQSPGPLLLAGILINFTFVLVEAGVGLAVGSLALLTDAGHNFSDVLGLTLSFVAVQLAQRTPSVKRTYGLRRTTIMAALLNAVILVAAVGAIIWEAISRFGSPESVPGTTLMWVAAIGVLVNGASALLFLRGRKKDLTLQSAFLHLGSDALVSLGVVVAGFLILLTGQAWIDSAISLGIAALIAVSTWGVLKESLNLLLDAVPPHINAAAVRQYLEQLPAVTGVHDLHIWALSTRETALTAHLILKSDVADTGLVTRAQHELATRFAITHATLQLEHKETPDCQHAAYGAV